MIYFYNRGERCTESDTSKGISCGDHVYPCMNEYHDVSMTPMERKTSPGSDSGMAKPFSSWSTDIDSMYRKH